MAKKLRLPILEHNGLISGCWTGEDSHGRINICHDDALLLLKMKPKHNYQITIYFHRPKRWTKSGLLVVEPVSDGNVLCFQKRDQTFSLPPETSKYLLDHDRVFFDGIVFKKVWIKAKKIKKNQ